MEPGFLFLLVLPVVIAIVVGVRLFAGHLDRERIRDYVETRGGRVVSAHWAPFGPGWFGSNKERIYQVIYLDHEGNKHDAFVRTSLWTGVYFTEDNIVSYGRPPIDDREVETLEEENARLRAELDRLKRKPRDPNSDAIRE